MTFTHKPFTGTIFPNDKGDNPNRPDHTGSFIMEEGGKTYRVALWAKESREGKPYFFAAFEPVEEN